MRTDQRLGILLALATAVISGVSIYVNKYAVAVFDDSTVFTTLKNTVVGLGFVIYLLAVRLRAGGQSPAPTHALSRWQWAGLAGLAVIGGSVPFLLFFRGLAIASAPSAALIHKSLFLWVALLAVPLLGERPGRWTMLGLGLLAVGQAIAGWPRGWGWGGGETLILIATLLWAAETVLARRLLVALPAAVGAVARMGGGALVMWLYLIAAGRAGELAALSAVQWMWLAITSVLLLGYVGTWYAALRHAPAATVTGLLTLGAVITSALSFGLDSQALAPAQATGLALLVLGAACLAGQARARRPHAVAAA